MPDVRMLRDEAGLRYGDRIPGSRLFRVFCMCCFEPMRTADVEAATVCQDCRGYRPLRSFHGHRHDTSDIQYHGSMFHSAEW